jgi:hypothetical protein
LHHQGIKFRQLFHIYLRIIKELADSGENLPWFAQNSGPASLPQIRHFFLKSATFFSNQISKVLEIDNYRPHNFPSGYRTLKKLSNQLRRISSDLKTIGTKKKLSVLEGL